MKTFNVQSKADIVYPGKGKKGLKIARRVIDTTLEMEDDYKLADVILAIMNRLRLDGFALLGSVEIMSITEQKV